MLFDEPDRSRLVDAIGQCQTLDAVHLRLVIDRWSSPAQTREAYTTATRLLVRLFGMRGAANWTSLSLTNYLTFAPAAVATVLAALSASVVVAERLVHLDLSGTPLNAAAAVASVCSIVASPACALQSLKLRGCSIGDAAMTAFADALTANNGSLRTLDVSHNRVATPAAHCALVRAGAWKLHEFLLAGNTGRGTQTFACPTWAEVFNAQSSSSIVGNDNGARPPLRVLDVSHSLYDSETLDGMFAALEHNCVLESLRISSMWSMDANRYFALLRSVARAPALRSLSIGSYMIGTTNEEYRRIGEHVLGAIEESRTLAELEATWMTFHEATLRGIYRAITSFRCPSLQRLALKECVVHGVRGRVFLMDEVFPPQAFDRALAVTAAVVRVVNAATPDLGDGQQTNSGGDLAALPNELLCIVAARLWPTRSLLQLGWTCRLLRDCSLNNYVAHQRYGAGYGDWRQHYRAAWLDDDRAAEVVPLELPLQHFA
jgi:hypothetical protein